MTLEDLANDPILEDYSPTVAANESANRLLSVLKDNPWGLSMKGQTAAEAARKMISIKHGLHSRIPITCKGDDCPYSTTCQLLPYDLAPVGEYCPREIAMVEALVQGYYSDFNLDEMSFTDRSLVNEVVFLDIMLERCKGLMAKEGVPVADVVIGLSEHGDEIRQEQVSKAWEAYEKITKRKDQKLQLLARTRNVTDKTQEDNHDSMMQIIMQNITEDDLKAFKKNSVQTIDVPTEEG